MRSSCTAEIVRNFGERVRDRRLREILRLELLNARNDTRLIERCERNLEIRSTRVGFFMPEDAHRERRTGRQHVARQLDERVLREIDTALPADPLQHASRG